MHPRENPVRRGIIRISAPIRYLAPLAYLSPHIVEAIANGTAPADLSHRSPAPCRTAGPNRNRTSASAEQPGSADTCGKHTQQTTVPICATRSQPLACATADGNGVLQLRTGLQASRTRSRLRGSRAARRFQNAPQRPDPRNGAKKRLNASLARKRDRIPPPNPRKCRTFPRERRHSRKNRYAWLSLPFHSN
jgi:hypothetical protein